MKQKYNFFYKEVDSTNDMAQELILRGKIQDFSVITAGNQTCGRGQGKNRWNSEKGKNLTFSIVLLPPFLKMSDGFIISKIVSLGIVDCVSIFTNDTKIKWPNDIYVGTKKIAGILIENAVQKDKISNCVCGIGLNVNQEKFSSGIPNPVSLKMIRNISFDLDEILQLLVGTIETRYEQFKNGQANKLNADYEQFLFQKGIAAYYKDDKGFFEGKISGVDQYGQLVIHDSEGKVRKYFMQEVSYL